MACLPAISTDDWSFRPTGSSCGESACLDGWFTPAPECDGAGLCVDQPSRACETGVCMNEQLCEGIGPAEGLLQLSEGTSSEPGARVRSDLPTIVLRLKLQSEGVGGTLNGLRLTFPGLEDIPLLWSRPEVRVYLDGDPADDQIDPDSQPLGVAILKDGVAQIDGLELSIPAFSEHQLLIELVTVRASQSASMGLLSVLCLMGLFASRRRLRRLWLVAILLAALALGTVSCVRYGWYRHLFYSTTLLENNSDVQVSTRPGDRLIVDGASIEGSEFLLDLSR
jgi:hypothetical protein